MMQFSIDELTNHSGGSIYKLVLLASRRATEINAGAPKLIEENVGKAGSIALQEIKQGKVNIKAQPQTAKD
jgi:DNA-directed RNA polymerase omega subunit